MFGINWNAFRGKDFREKAQVANKNNKTPSDDNYRHNNFELLSIEIVESITKREWIHTDWARDLNHDAYAVISLYCDNLDGKKSWWLEAKYSYSAQSKNLTRYRLDATLVSKLLEDSKGKPPVSHIFFFTNSNVQWKVKNDISNALYVMGHKCRAFFYERKDIEYWLFQHREIYRKYFTDNKEFRPKEATELYLDKHIEIVPSYFKYLNFQYCPYDNLELIKGNTYIVSINIYGASKKWDPQISVPHGIKILDKPKYFSDRHSIEFKIKVTSEPRVPLSFCVDDYKTEPIRFVYKQQTMMEIASHLKILSATNSFIVQNSRCACSALLVLGANATGKTTLLHQIMEKTVQPSVYISFTYDYSTNIRYLCNFIFSLFLPYFDWETVDLDYISSLKETKGFGFGFLEELWLFVESLKNQSAQKERIESFSFVFPEFVSHKTTILFIDNIQRLRAEDGCFFQKLIKALQRSSFSVKVIAFGNTYFQDNPVYSTLCELKTPGTVYNASELRCELTMVDVIKFFNKIFSANIKLSLKNQIFINLLEINEFVKYIRKNEIEISDDASFILEFSRYKNNELAIVSIKEYIYRAIEQCNNVSKQLLKEIYLLPRSIKYIDDNTSQEVISAKEELLGLNLVKVSLINNTLEPFHETYRNIYIRFLATNLQNCDLSWMGDQESIIVDFNFPISHEKRIDAAKTLCGLPHKQPGTVLYALEPIFSRVDELQDALVRMYGVELFFKLFQSYAISCGYNSVNVSGLSQHEKLVQMAKNYMGYGVDDIVLDSEYEILNSKFDGLLIDEAKSAYSKYLEHYQRISRFQNLNTEKWKTRKLLAQEIDVLIKCIEEDPNSEAEFLSLREQYIQKPVSSNHHFIGFTARYAQLLYATDINKAYMYTLQSYKMMSKNKNSMDEKHLKEVSFQKVYIEMLKNDNPHFMPDLIKKYHSFNDGFRTKQRKVRCALLMACLKFDDNDSADVLLEDEMREVRKRRARLDMFFKQALALYALKRENDFSKAINILTEARSLVERTPSYCRIIDHNLNLLRTNKGIPHQFQFALSKEMATDIYYIDPRADR